MLKKLLPIVLLAIGSGAGVGAGIFLRPAPVEEEQHAGDTEEKHEEDHAEAPKDHDEETPLDREYVKMSNQFVVPIVKDGRVASLVVMSLSIEVPAGGKDDVLVREPKLRDSFLRVLFDHANIGGFEGDFTDANTLAVLRTALREIAQKDMGVDMVSDVLILDIARQDY